MTVATLHPAVRPAGPDDVARIRELVLALATYERAAEQVKFTEQQLRDALFGAAPAVYALVAETDGAVVGFAIYFLSFSTWEGTHGIYLEDLFVEPAHRGSGLGQALLGSLAAIARARGYARVEWWVLDWNEPSIAFYRRLGAEPMEEWTVFRLSGPALERAAAAVTEPPPTFPQRAAGPHRAEQQQVPHPLGVRDLPAVGRVTRRRAWSCWCRPGCPGPSWWRWSPCAGTGPWRRSASAGAPPRGRRSSSAPAARC